MSLRLAKYDRMEIDFVESNSNLQDIFCCHHVTIATRRLFRQCQCSFFFFFLSTVVNFKTSVVAGNMNSASIFCNVQQRAEVLLE